MSGDDEDAVVRCRGCGAVCDDDNGCECGPDCPIPARGHL